MRVSEIDLRVTPTEPVGLRATLIGMIRSKELRPRAEGGVMDEQLFWVSLEFRLCHEFAGLPDRRYQYFWCDGFIPGQYLLDDPQPQITGKAWICNGPAQAEWDFTLLLPRPFGSRGEIDWASLLPPKDVTRWMAFDEGRRYIEIEPAVAVPDLR